MRNIAGGPVRGSDFFNRDNIIDDAWDLIERDSNILIAAPRRVGKTSLMFYLMDHPKENHSFLYLTTESVNNENEFFRRLVNKLMQTSHVQNSQKILTFLKVHLPTVKKVGPDGVEFGSKETHNYFEIVQRILKSISSESGKLVIMIDEFPETLENIIQDEGESPGIRFLQSNRELRQDPDISRNVQFIYTGSIGLENIVSRLNAVSAIIDLDRLKIPPLKQEEAMTFIGLLLEDASFSLSKSLIDRTLERVEWLIPFYIQLVIEELGNVCRDQNLSKVSQPVLDRAFTSLLEKRNAFEHWHTRLRTSLKIDEYNFAKELLNVTSENISIHSNEILDIAVKYRLTETYKNLVDSLVYDGYIHREDADKYKYNSPILRMWWRQNVAH